MSNNTRSAFTLVEVAICGALLSFSVLTALAIIPRGLMIQNESRMKAVAAAAVVTLAADAHQFSITKFMGPCPSSLTPASIKPQNWLGADCNQPDKKIVTGVQNPGENTSTRLFVILNSTDPGRMERRLVFSVDTRSDASTLYNGRQIYAWLLNRDADKFPTQAKYLATFTEGKWGSPL